MGFMPSLRLFFEPVGALKFYVIIAIVTQKLKSVN